MKKICFIANKYPNIVDPNGLVFLQQLIWEIADMGNECVVICPLATNLNLKYLKVPEHIMEITENGNKVDIYFPKFFGLGQSHYIFGRSPVSLTTSFFSRAVLKIIRKYNMTFDFIYGHFIAPAGIASVRVGKKLHIPSFIGYGESTTWSIDQFGRNNVKKELKDLAGMIAVSYRNKELAVSNKIITNNKIDVFPNGYRKERFYKLNKEQARKHFDWDNKKFIIGFCGSFDDRKGVHRLEKAIDMIDDSDVVFACAGKGKLVPTSDKCIFKQPVNNDELIYFYNAIDVFCLPTLNEGCCNAIIEAMACGCPIISSDESFNYDILDGSNSLLINPNSIIEIKNSIEKLKNDSKMLRRLKKGCIDKAKHLTLNERAKNILKYMCDN